jgi:hypothetical protein
MFDAPATGGHAVNDEFSGALWAFHREAKFYDIAALFLWLVGGIARKGNAKRRKTMSTKNEKAEEKSSLDYIAWSVEKRNGKTYWTRVGVAFKPHKDGEGFTARFAAGIAVSGEIVFRKPKPEEVQAVTGSDDDIPF